MSPNDHPTAVPAEDVRGPRGGYPGYQDPYDPPRPTGPRRTLGVLLLAACAVLLLAIGVAVPWWRLDPFLTVGVIAGLALGILVLVRAARGRLTRGPSVAVRVLVALVVVCAAGSAVLSAVEDDKPGHLRSVDVEGAAVEHW